MSMITPGGMLANMCVESHLRELLERGFEVAIFKDATAGPHKGQENLAEDNIKPIGYLFVDDRRCRSARTMAF